MVRGGAMTFFTTDKWQFYTPSYCTNVNDNSYVAIEDFLSGDITVPYKRLLDITAPWSIKLYGNEPMDVPVLGHPGQFSKRRGDPSANGIEIKSQDTKCDNSAGSSVKITPFSLDNTAAFYPQRIKQVADRMDSVRFLNKSNSCKLEPDTTGQGAETYANA